MIFRFLRSFSRLACICECAFPDNVVAKIDKTSSLVNTAQNYKQHLVIQTGEHSTWPSHIEKEDIVERIKEKLKETEKERDVMISLSDYQSGIDCEGEFVSAFIFPDCHGLQFKRSDVDPVIDALHKTNSTNNVNTPFVLICGHTNRDFRCAAAGPILADCFRMEMESVGIKGNVQIVSHIGGHKFAGNVIVYPSGNWYGRVGPEDVGEIVETLKSGGVVDRLWRGCGFKQ